MLIVSSLSDACRAYAEYKPARVISLLSDDDAVPCFDALPAERHLQLYVDRESCGESINAAARRRAEDVVGFVRKWDGRGDILVHCSRGVSRSTAAAFVVMCLREPNTAEAALASRLRAAAPFADPCPLLIAYADALMGRGGRMIDAIEDLPPPIPTIRAPTVALPLS
ncbi:MAG: tyrosine phosphatase family protein [Amphiplicatus sp.]